MKFVKALGLSSLLLLSLVACTATETADPPAKEPIETVAPIQCSGLSGEEALAKWAGDVTDGTGRTWDISGTYSDVTTYDECAELSVIVLRPDLCCTVYERTPVMFFHRGEYVPSATVTDQVVAKSDFDRATDNELTVSYRIRGLDGAADTSRATKYSWDEKSGTVVSAEEEPEAQSVGGAAGMNGHWCPTSESLGTYGCVTVELPTARYDNGNTLELRERVNTVNDGGKYYMGPGAPFGTYYPAGMSISLPDYYPGADLPDQDRIWNGQTATMLVRQ